MMLSKKNSEALENFSEKLEVEGRSLWQGSRRRILLL
ncbi:peptide ABC transporter permease, partial [Klebsiella pneumoniae]